MSQTVAAISRQQTTAFGNRTEFFAVLLSAVIDRDTLRRAEECSIDSQLFDNRTYGRSIGREQAVINPDF